MNVNTVKAFDEAVKAVFKTALRIEVKVGRLAIKQDISTTHDVSGIIGITGAVKGVIVLSFPQAVAETLFCRFTGASLTGQIPLSDFADAIGELTNMVAGNAKARLDHGHASISCPTVILGRGISVLRPRHIPSLCLPCECEDGCFVIELSLNV